MARWVERDGERVVLEEAYDERLHPRGRGGRWIGKLVRVKDKEWQQALDKEATKGKVVKTKDDPRGTIYLGGNMPPSRTGTVLSVDGDKATVRFGDQVRNGVSLTAIEPVEPTMGVDKGEKGPVVNGEQFAPGYTPEAAAYEQKTREGRGAFGWPATQHPGQSSNDAPEPPRKIDVDTSEIVAPGPVDIANGWKSEGTRGDYADQFGDMAVGQAYVSRYTNPATGDTVEIGRFIEYDQARNQPGNPYRYTVQTQTTEWNAKDDPSGDYADISYDDEDVMFYMSYGDALQRLLALARKDETSMFSGEPVGAEGRAKATPGQGRLFEGARPRWVERNGERVLSL